MSGTYPQMLYKLPNAKAVATNANEAATLQGLGFSTSLPAAWADDPGHSALFVSVAAAMAFYGPAGKDGGSDVPNCDVIAPNTGKVDQG